MNQREDLRTWNNEQIKEMQGPVNRWLAGEKLGHEPTPQEAARHYVENGGPVDFARRHRRQGSDSSEQSSH